MRKSLLFIFLSLASFSFFQSCKSKRIIIEEPPASDTVQRDTQVDDLQNELPDTKVERVDEGVKVTFDSNILFELNSSYLTEAAHEQLRDLVKALEKHPYTSIRIDGHTDDTGTDEYNKWLSARRAASVKKFLESVGVSGESMQTAGHGESSPLVANDTPEGQAKNRRVEVTIKQK